MSLTFNTALMAAFYAALFTFTVPTVSKAYTVQLLAPVNSVIEDNNSFSEDNNSFVVQRRAPVVNAILHAAAQSNGKTLWSMYPASVRGRTFAKGSSRGGGRSRSRSGSGWN